MLEAYLSMFIKAVFIENIAINFFLGMCTFLAISKRIQPAIGLGIAVIVVLGLAVPINNLIFNFFPKRGCTIPRIRFTFCWADLLHRNNCCVSSNLRNVFRSLYTRTLQCIGCLFAFNYRELCYFRGVLFSIERNLAFTESIVYGLGAGTGWALAIVALAGITERLKYADIPEGLQGLGITFITVGLMCFGFLSFGGISL